MNLESWKSQAASHWRWFQPTRYRELVRKKTLEAALQDAAERTHREMSALEEQGFHEREAWEMVRELYLLPPEEQALKAKNDRRPVASEAARMFNEIAQLKSQILRGDDEIE